MPHKGSIFTTESREFLLHPKPQSYKWVMYDKQSYTMQIINYLQNQLHLPRHQVAFEVVNHLINTKEMPLICVADSDTKTLVENQASSHTFDVINILKNISHIEIKYYENPSHISKEDAEKLKYEAEIGTARLLVYNNNRPKQAIELLEELLKQHPSDARILFEIGNIYLFQKKYREAYQKYLVALDYSPPLDIESKIVIAMTDLGSYKKANALIKDLKNKIKHIKPVSKFRKLFFSTHEDEASTAVKQIVLKDCVIAYYKMGYFKQGIALCKELIHEDPTSVELYLLLAQLFTQAERFAEAEETCKLLHHKFPDNPLVVKKLLEIYVQENNYPKVLDCIANLLTDNEHVNEELLFLKANILYDSLDLQGALKVYDSLRNTPFQSKLLIGKGKTLLAQGKTDAAKQLFQEAFTRFPDEIEPQFYHAVICTPDRDTLSELLKNCKDPYVLLEWSRLYKERKKAKPAMMLAELAATLNPEFITARDDMVGFYGTMRDEKRGIPAVQALIQEFPHNDKFILQKARIYSYCSLYMDALESYTAIIALDPENPVPQLDRARSAFWGKNVMTGEKLYQRMLYPTVDQDLQAALGPLSDKCGLKKKENIEPLIPVAFKSRTLIYTDYERLIDSFETLPLSIEEKEKVNEILLQLWAKYRIQKAVYLEIYAKILFWNNRYLEATVAYKELMQMQPGNREAIFDYSLVRCHLGICTDSLQTVNRLLHIDPIHTEATQMHLRETVNGHPAIACRYQYWRERGFGDVSAMKRWDKSFTATLPVNCRHQFYARKTYRKEKSLLFNTTTYSSHLETVGYKALLTDHFSTNLEYAQKTYERRFKKRFIGLAELYWRTCDYLTLGAGYEKTNELYNYFGFKQGVQSKRRRFSLDSYITKYLLVHAGSENIRYSDNNRQRFYNAEIGYQFLEEPFSFYVYLNGEHRNTAKISRDIVAPIGTQNEGNVLNQRHPYWTPQHYRAGRIRLRFLKHLIEPVYCANLERFFDINVTYKKDNDHESGYEFDGIFHYDITNRLRFELRGVRYSYDNWKAHGWWVTLEYHF